MYSTPPLLVVSAAWNCLFGNATTEPDNPYFVTIKSIWTDIDHRKPTKESFISDPSLLRLEFQVISEPKEKLSKAAETDSVIARGDYKQCAENTLSLLRKKEDYHPHRPGATHSARWIGQLLHIQKLFMLSDQLPFTTEIMLQLTRMTQFVVLLYPTSWLNTSLGADALYNDLKFIHQMMDYRAVDNEMAEAALQKALKHRWYLGAELVVFAMFSSNQNISFETKVEMAKTLLQITQPEVFRNGKPVFVHVHRSTKLFDLIGPEL